MSLNIKKAIDPKDIPQIKKTLTEAFGCEDYTDISRLGGLTNHTYRVTIQDGAEYAVRIPGDGTEGIINRENEKISTELACRLDIDAELMYFDSTGAKVSKYIDNAVTMDDSSLRNRERIRQCADVFKRLHGCGEDTQVEFDVFKMAQTYEEFIYEHNVTMFADYDKNKECVRRICGQMQEVDCLSRVPCHNDPLCENWVDGNGRLYLIDWEYAGMNDGMWDIAATSIEADFNKDDDYYFLKCYLGREPENGEMMQLIASKVFVDYLWTLWAKMRTPFDGQPMEDWAKERYERMSVFIDEYEQRRFSSSEERAVV